MAGGGSVRLTGREREVLHLIAHGLLNKEIAAELGVSEQTVKNFMTELLYKYDVHGRIDLLRKALKVGDLALDDL